MKLQFICICNNFAASKNNYEKNPTICFCNNKYIFFCTN